MLSLLAAPPLWAEQPSACNAKEPRKIVASSDEIAQKIRARVNAGEELSEDMITACGEKIQNCVKELSPLVKEDFEIIRRVGQDELKMETRVHGTISKAAMSRVDNGGDLTTCDRDGMAARTAAAVAIDSAQADISEGMVTASERVSFDSIQAKTEELKKTLLSSELDCQSMQKFDDDQQIAKQADSYKSSLIEAAAKMEAVYDICDKFLQEVKTGKKTERLEQRLYAAMRAHSDLPKWALYESWPGCQCSPGLKDSRMIGGVCFRGVTPFDPIDERMSPTLALFAGNLQKWAGDNGLRLKNIQMGGCSVARFSRLKEDKDGDFDRLDLSPHAEARACDLYAATFEDLKTGKPSTVSFLDKDVRDRKKKGEKHPFAKAFIRYLDSKKEDAGLVRVPLTPLPEQQKDNGEPKIPVAIYDYAKVLEDTQSQCALAPAECEQVHLGAAVIAAARKTGFLAVAPGTDATHVGHVHMSLSTRAKCWDTLSDPNARQADKDTIIDYYVAHALKQEGSLRRPACAPPETLNGSK